MGGKKNRPKTKWRKLSLDELKSTETEEGVSESQNGTGKSNRYHSKEVNVENGCEIMEQGYPPQDFQDDGMEHFESYEDYQGAEGESEADEITGCYVNGLWVPQSELHRLTQSGIHPPLLVPSPTGYTMLVPRPVTPSANFLFPASCIPASSSSHQIPPYFRLRSDFRFQKPFRLPRRSYRLAPYWGSLNAPCAFAANMPAAGPPPHMSAPPAPPSTPPSDNTASSGLSGDATPVSHATNAMDEGLAVPMAIHPSDDLASIDRIEDQLLSHPASYVYPGYTYGPAVYCPHFVPAPNGGPFLPPPGPLLPPALDFAANSRGRRRRRKYRGRFHYGMEGPSREVWRASDEKKKLNPTPKESVEVGAGSTKPVDQLPAAQSSAVDNNTDKLVDKCDSIATCISESSQSANATKTVTNATRPSDLDLPINPKSDIYDYASAGSVASDTIINLAESVVNRAIREATTFGAHKAVETSVSEVAPTTLNTSGRATTNNFQRTNKLTSETSEITKMTDNLAKNMVSEGQKVHSITNNDVDKDNNIVNVQKNLDSHVEDKQNQNEPGCNSCEQKSTIRSPGENEANTATGASAGPAQVHKAPRFIVVTIPSEELSDSEYESSSSDEELMPSLRGTITPDPLTVFDAELNSYPALETRSNVIKSTAPPQNLNIPSPKINVISQNAEPNSNSASKNKDLCSTANSQNNENIRATKVDQNTWSSSHNLIDFDEDNNRPITVVDAVLSATEPNDKGSPHFVDVPLSDTPATTSALSQFNDKAYLTTTNAESSSTPSSDDDLARNHIMSSRTRVEDWLMNQTASPSQQSIIAGSLSSVNKETSRLPESPEHFDSSLTDSSCNRFKRQSANPQRLETSELDGALAKKNATGTTPTTEQHRSSPAYLSFLGQSDTLLRETEMELSRLKMLQSCKTNQNLYKLAYDETVSEGQSSDNNEPDAAVSSNTTKPSSVQDTALYCAASRPGTVLKNDQSVLPESSSLRRISPPQMAKDRLDGNSGETQPRNHSEIIVHEKDSASEAGSEDVELLPHRYESGDEVSSHQKHLYVNKLSLATELLRTKETLPYDKEFKRVVEDSTDESDSTCRNLMHNYYGSNAGAKRAVGDSKRSPGAGKGSENLGFECDTPAIVTADLRPRTVATRMSAADSGVQSEESSDEVGEEAREKVPAALRPQNSEEEEEQDVWNARATGSPGPRYRRLIGLQAGQRARGLPIRDTAWPCVCCAIM